MDACPPAGVYVSPSSGLESSARFKSGLGLLSAFRGRVSGVHFSRAGRWSQFLLTAFADGLSWGWRGEGPSAAPLAGLSLVGRAGRGSRAPSVGHEPHCRRAGARVLGCSPAPARADWAAASRDCTRLAREHENPPTAPDEQLARRALGHVPVSAPGDLSPAGSASLHAFVHSSSLFLCGNDFFSETRF